MQKQAKAYLSIVQLLESDAQLESDIFALARPTLPAAASAEHTTAAKHLPKH